MSFPKTLIVTNPDEVEYCLCLGCARYDTKQRCGEEDWINGDYIEIEKDKEDTVARVWQNVNWCYNPNTCSMIWCWWSGKCSHSVIDPFVEPRKITIDEVRERYPRFTMPSNEDVDLTYWEVGVARIDRIIDNHMAEYAGTRELTPTEVGQLLEYIGNEKVPPLDLMSRLQIAKHEFYDELLDDKENAFNISLPVNSFMVFHPETPYPNGFDMAHDGCNIYLECTSAIGKKFRMTFWGD